MSHYRRSKLQAAAYFFTVVKYYGFDWRYLDEVDFNDIIEYHE